MAITRETGCGHKDKKNSNYANYCGFICIYQFFFVTLRPKLKYHGNDY